MTSEQASKQTTLAKRMLRSILLVSSFTFATQVVMFVTQLVIAHLFGARADMDAFLAATAEIVGN